MNNAMKKHINIEMSLSGYGQFYAIFYELMIDAMDQVW